MRRWGLTPPQWRDLPEDDRDLMTAEDALVCSDCGNLKSVCRQPGLVLYPQKDECFYTASRQLVERRLAEKFKKDEPGTEDLHALDGVSVWLSEYDLEPDETFFDLPTRRLSEPESDG